MRLKFTKMHGLGNDFVVIDSVSQKVTLSAAKARKLADRHFGVGCDQILIVEPPRTPYADFRYRIFNANGEEVEHCGNGVRCFAIFVQQRSLCSKNTIRVETGNGIATLTVRDDKQVVVDMGAPVLEPSEIPFDYPNQEQTYRLALQDRELEISAVSMGNPHAVCIVEDVDQFPVTTVGPEIESHPMFPKHANAGFLEIQSRNKAKLRVYERGVGETLACGTGACAAMVAACQRGLLDSEATISLRGGDLSLKWLGETQSVIMTGPAENVFSGQIKI